MARAANPKPRNYVEELPTSLAWSTSTQTMMVTGLAGEVIAAELAAVPEDLTSMGVVLRKGRRERLNTQRTWGDPLQWQTASLSARASRCGESARVPLTPNTDFFKDLVPFVALVMCDFRLSLWARGMLRMIPPCGRFAPTPRRSLRRALS